MKWDDQLLGEAWPGYYQVFSPDLKVLWVSSAFRSEEAPLAPFTAGVGEALARARESKERVGVENQKLSCGKDREEKIWNVNFIPVGGKGDGAPEKLSYILGQWEEVTPSFRLKEKVEALEKELESFCFSLSHDLKAPLRSIGGFGQIMLEDFGENLPLKMKDYLQSIINSSKKMGQLIDGLVKLSRTGKGPLRREWVNLTSVAAGALARLKMNEPGREVRVNLEENLMVQGDHQLLEALLTQLLENAWKFTSRNPQATLEVGTIRKEGGEQVFFVRDNGVGFRPDYAAKLFAPFQRLHGGQEFPGVGVGLPMAAKIVLKHGGKIWAESKVDERTTFFFTLGPQGEKKGVP